MRSQKAIKAKIAELKRKEEAAVLNSDFQLAMVYVRLIAALEWVLKR